MSYFTNIQSFDDLKKRYRELVLMYHPDKGGSEEEFKKMGAEYEQLYSVWKHRKNDGKSNFSYQEPCEGWVGSRRSEYVSLKDTAEKVRRYAKEKYPQFTFSVCIDRGGSYCGSIDVYLMQSPYKINPADTDDAVYAATSVWYDASNIGTPEVRDAILDIRTYLMSYNYDKSDARFDYFNRGFYERFCIGKHDKPYKVEVNRKFRTGGDGPKEFKWKDGPAHAAIKKALAGKTFNYQSCCVRCGNDSGAAVYAPDRSRGLLLGTYNFYCQTKTFDATTYTPTIARRMKQRLADAGIVVNIINAWSTYKYLQYESYTPEAAAALAAEDRAKEEAYKQFLNGSKAKTGPAADVKVDDAPINTGDIEITQYSERAVAVFGNTRAHKDRLKALGGRFCRNLRGRAGWVFPRTKEAALRKEFSIS